MTVRSVPTSEWTPSAVVVSVLIVESLLSSAGRCRDADAGAADEEDGGEGMPHELYVLVVAELGQLLAAAAPTASPRSRLPRSLFSPRPKIVAESRHTVYGLDQRSRIRKDRPPCRENS